MTDKQPAQPAKNKKPSRTEQRRQARSLALQALYQWEMSGSTVTDIEAEFRAEQDLSRADVALFVDLLHRIPAQVSVLDEQVLPFLDRKLDDLDPIELTILRIGGFELKERIEVPYKVAINESVNLAKTFGATDSHKYINGVLDKLARVLRPLEVNAPR